jgi:hypothetical protein
MSWLNYKLTRARWLLRYSPRFHGKKSQKNPPKKCDRHIICWYQNKTKELSSTCNQIIDITVKQGFVFNLHPYQ